MSDLIYIDYEDGVQTTEHIPFGGEIVFDFSSIKILSQNSYQIEYGLVEDKTNLFLQPYLYQSPNKRGCKGEIRWTHKI